jgi:CDP-diacylglycerol--glycerol-3-phosphate 3-phosphatidyltransferase
MASVYDLKPRFQDLLRSIVIKLADHGYTANQVTVAAALLSIVTGALLMKYSTNQAILLLLPVVLFIHMALNAIDGMLAREHDMKTPLGTILNELGDVISDAALYLPLALVSDFPPKLMVVMVVLAVISEMVGVSAVQIGATRRYDGPMGKSDRAFVFGALGFLLAIGLFPRAWVFFAMSIVCILLVITIVNRGRRALAEVAQ